VAAYQQSPKYAAAEKVIKLAAAMEQLPPIPEEARKHFVMGQTMFKAATSTNDFSLARQEFGQSVRSAPWWPEARYNLALALEAAGNYTNAISSLKLYQLFKLSDAEARAVQDKIYALEAKQEMAAKEAQAKAEQEAQKRRQEAAEKERLQSFEGTWSLKGANTGLVLSRDSAGKYSAVQYIEIGGSKVPEVEYSHQDIQTSGRNIKIKLYARNGEADEYDFTLSEDGQTLSGEEKQFWNSGARPVFHRVFYRH